MIRDKAHNNALSGHRKLINKKNQFEVLDFLNKRQRDSLLDKFGDINAIYQASKNDLEGIKFIGPKTINKIYEHISKY
jgi:excinuclease UvrABC nuclease subunit